MKSSIPDTPYTIPRTYGGYFCKNNDMRIKPGNRTNAYLGKEEKLPENVGIKYPMVRKSE